jgi:general secretion pathway protein D
MFATLIASFASIVAPAGPAPLAWAGTLPAASSPASAHAVGRPAPLTSAAAPTAAPTALKAPAQGGRGAPPADNGGAARATTSPTGQEVPPIQEEGDSFILNFAEKEGEDGMSLYQFIKACEQATGLQFVVLPDSTQALDQEKVRMIGTKRIPKRDFYSFFQIIMFIHNYACVEVGGDATSVIVIQSRSPQGARAGQNNITQKTEYVLPEELEQFADQPATLITTVITLPNTDVRNLSNSLRSLITDTQSLNMVPAGNSNSLILQGYGSYIVQLARLLFLIDEESVVAPPDMPQFDYVPLEFASADDVADMVEQLLEASREALRQARQNRTVEGQVQPQVPGNEADAKIIVDRRTNSLGIMALPDDMPRIKELIARLDTELIEPERNYHIYTLENVGAEELATVLEEFLDDAQRITESAGGTGGRTNQTGAATTGGSSGSDEVIVVAEPSTNSLLIAANKTRYSEVLELVRTLDRRADQVLIETALIELSGNDFRDIGVELGFADLPGIDETGGFGVTGMGLSTLEDSDGDGAPDLRVPINSNGLTAGILDGDDFALPFLVRLLKTRENANVLSVPSILVNNNGSATISTLDERPFTTVTAFGGGGGQTQENFNGYQEAGITLTISPSISASRYLRLGVELEVSNFLGATTAASIPPPRVTRRLLTTINVPDGDTMVIGGVITNNTTEQRTQLPWLGDIPVLGFLFRRDQDTLDKRTLYFFVTPHILADKDFADLAEISYEAKLRASETIGADRLRVIDPDFGVTDDDEALMGFEVPLYRRPPVGEVQGDDVGLDPQRRAALLEEAREQAGEPVPAETPAESSLGGEPLGSLEEELDGTEEPR